MIKIKKTAADIQDKKTKKIEQKELDLEGQLKRALADYQNLERRIDEERRLLSALSSALLCGKLLPVLDNLENAQKHLKDEGLEMVIKQFNDVLESEGVEEITAEGSPFDPNFHEAVEILESEKDGVVLKVLAKGYKINDKVLRPAQVAVGRTKVDHRVEDDSTGEKKSEELGDYAQ
ncbi:nucleotide exchange factor GrpE [Candidatus Curtissbacteria bacterium RIFCSPHIGHO2_02_FULL_42_15]|uniref:Protein GrpE n=1 Tax=Candidatus Curtissbacteria bacterium RIFCSPHIGHO2_02_FULL_42_15 TaxID=1797716 RepID=A0A1F5GEK1_9BACT|nr:MAG: nucleotide exchange factor GrpE [Candidatus Curtissbacteria bacterium RIFCSPHIGHO2_02_FULL_42_15]